MSKWRGSAKQIHTQPYKDDCELKWRPNMGCMTAWEVNIHVGVLLGNGKENGN